jgi:hypothetical protein
VIIRNEAREKVDPQIRPFASDVDAKNTYPDEAVQIGGGVGQGDLLAVYVMLEALSTQVGSDLDNSPDLFLYERLFAFLKLASKTEGLGYMLREVLITLVRTNTGRPIVEKALGSSMSFSLLCSALAGHVCGEIDGLDEAPGVALLSDPANMATLQGMYSDASAQSEPITLEGVRALKAEVAKKIVDAAPQAEEAEDELHVFPVDASGEERQRGWRPSPPEKDDLPETMPSTPIGGRRTRRGTQSFLPHRRRRSHQAIRMSSSRHSPSGSADRR